MLREILEKYKREIHGSEFDFHQKGFSLNAHQEQMDKAQAQAIKDIEARLLTEKEIATIIDANGFLIYDSPFSNATHTINIETLARVLYQKQKEKMG
jgi:hypothetical protein